jgi:hypothetical protein
MSAGNALGGVKGRRNGLSRLATDRYAGLLLSFIAGTVASAVAYVSHANLGTSVGLGVVIFIAGQLIDISFRIESWIEDLSRRLASVEAELTTTGASLRDLSTASALEGEFKKAILHLTSGKGESGAELANTLGRIVEALPNIPPLLAGYTREKLELTAGALAAKNFQEVGEDVPYIGTILARDFRKCLFATSLFPLPFWETGWGQTYHDEMCSRVSQSIRDGSRILAQRVFIVRHGTEADLAGDSYHNRMVREQIAAGIEIRACYETDLASPEFRQDFGIWDHELAVLVQVSVDTKGIRKVTGTNYQYEKGEIARLEGIARRIWSISRPFDTWLTGQNP